MYKMDDMPSLLALDRVFDYLNSLFAFPIISLCAIDYRKSPPSASVSDVTYAAHFRAGKWGTVAEYPIRGSRDEVVKLFSQLLVRVKANPFVKHRLDVETKFRSKIGTWDEL